MLRKVDYLRVSNILEDSHVYNYGTASVFLFEDIARKTMFLKSWNIMTDSKTPSTCHLFIIFLALKKTVFPSQKTSKQELFSNH